jgi:hypothetical protein
MGAKPSPDRYTITSNGYEQGEPSFPLLHGRIEKFYPEM